MGRPRTVVRAGYKKCNGPCGRVRPIEAFWKHKGYQNKDERDPRCADCLSAERRERDQAKRKLAPYPDDPIPLDKLTPENWAMLGQTVEAFADFFATFSGYGALAAHMIPVVRSFFAEDNTMVNIARKHAKTTTMEWLVIHHLAANRNGQVLLLSKTSYFATRSARNIAWHLEFNEALNHAYGRFRPLDRTWPWRPESGELMVWGRDRSLATGDMSLQVRGSEQQILGMEGTLLVADDITDRETARSETKSETELDRLRGPALGCLVDDAKALVIGQRVHPRDLYARLLEQEEEEAVRVWCHENYPAVLEGDLLSDADEDIKLLWPEPRKGSKDPLAWLRRQRKRFGWEQFQTYFQQAPSAEGAGLVRESWIAGCLDEDRGLGQPVPRTPMGAKTRVISVDPSPSRYAGIVVADVAFEDLAAPVIQVLDVHREFDMGTEGLLSILMDLQMRYGAQVLVMEMNSVKIIQRDSVWDALRALFRYVIKHDTTAHSKEHRDLGFWTMAAAWEFGRLRLPWKTQEAQEASGILIREALGQLPTDDCLMAAWFIHYNQGTLRYYSPETFIAPIKPSGMGWGEAFTKKDKERVLVA